MQRSVKFNLYRYDANGMGKTVYHYYLEGVMEKQQI